MSDADVTGAPLTPEQARALRVVHAVLDLDKDSTDTDARRAGALRTALQMVADAFPEDAS